MILFKLERGRVVLEVERAPFPNFHVGITLDEIGIDLLRDFNGWAPHQPAEKTHELCLSDNDKASEKALNPLTDEEKAVIVRQEIKQIIAVKVGLGKATRGILTNKSNNVVLYSYVSGDKTITPT